MFYEDLVTRKLKKDTVIFINKEIQSRFSSSSVQEMVINVVVLAYLYFNNGLLVIHSV